MNSEQKRRTRQLAEFKLMVEQSPLTAEYLWRIMDVCGVFRDYFHSDPYQCAHQAGMKLSGQLVLDDFMQGAPEVLARLMMNPPVEPQETDDEDDNA